MTTVLDLPADAAPSDDDVAYGVNDPGGSPGDRHYLFGDLAASAPWATRYLPMANPTATGVLTAPRVAASGATGATAVSRYVGATNSGAPVSGTHNTGDWVIARDGAVYICTAGGTPGTWVDAAAAALLTIPEAVAGDNIDIDDSLPGFAVFSLLADIVVDSVVADLIESDLAAIGGTHSGDTTRELEVYGTVPSVDGYCFGTGTFAAPAAVLAGAVIWRSGAHAWHSGGAYTSGDARLEFLATENQTGAAQGQRGRLLTKPNGATAAVEVITYDQDGAVRAIRPLGGIGYGTGAGGTVAQGAGSGKATAVTLDKVCGEITTDAANLNSNTTVSFVVNCAAIAATDVVTVVHKSGGTGGGYLVWAHSIGAGVFSVAVRNVSGSPLAEVLVLTVKVDRAVTA